MRNAVYLSFLVLCGCDFESRPLVTTAQDGGVAPVWAPTGRSAPPAAESGASASQSTPAAPAVSQPPSAASAGAPAMVAAARPPADMASAAAEPIDQDAGMGRDQAGPDAGGASAPAKPTQPATSDKMRVEQLIEAVNALFDPGARSGKGNANTELKQWRMLARRSGALTEQVVSQALGAIEQRGTCFVRPEACVSVCAVIAESCSTCAADARCEASLARVCGPTVARCPSQPAP